MRAQPPRVGDGRLLCIDGRSGSGKSTLARQVADAAGADLVELESLYAGWGGLLDAPGRAAAQIVGPLAEGRVARYRTWDWHADAWNGVREQAPVPLLVIEGVGAAAPPLAGWASLTLWLDLPADARKERALARDGATFAARWDDWAAQEQELLAGYPQPRADVVVTLDGADLS
ncbi:hypothetical protein NODU109028_05290 [Nocardioides dubius]